MVVPLPTGQLFRPPEVGGEEWSLEKWVEAPLRHLEREFALSPDVENLFAATRRAAQKLMGSPLPLVLSNWSFSRGNVCRSAQGIAVYDWETVGRGLPLVDLMYFLVDWGRLVQKASAASWRRTFRDLLIDPPGDRVSRAVDRSVSSYLPLSRSIRVSSSARCADVDPSRGAGQKDGVPSLLDPRLIAFAGGQPPARRVSPRPSGLRIERRRAGWRKPQAQAPLVGIATRQRAATRCAAWILCYLRAPMNCEALRQ
jgi:hypothetical protein